MINFNSYILKNLWIIILLFYFISLFLPVYYSLDEPIEKAYGYEVLIIGFMGFLVGDLRWLANFLLFYVVFCLYKRKKIIFPYFLILLFLIVFISVVFFDYWDARFSFGYGAYVWSSCLLLCAFSCFLDSHND